MARAKAKIVERCILKEGGAKHESYYSNERSERQIVRVEAGERNVLMFLHAPQVILLSHVMANPKLFHNWLIILAQTNILILTTPFLLIPSIYCT